MNQLFSVTKACVFLLISICWAPYTHAKVQNNYTGVSMTGYIDQNGDWIALVNRYHIYLSTRFSGIRTLTSNQQNTARVIKQSVPSSISDAERSAIILSLLDLGRYTGDPVRFTGFIEDSIVLDIIIAALKDPYPSVRNNAFSYLLDYGRTDMLQKRSKDIKKNLVSPGFDEPSTLVALLNLSAEEKDIILMQKTTPFMVKARLGDQDAERTLINQFDSATTYKDKSEAARKLGYIGSDRAVKTLVSGLSSNLALEAAYEHVSIKYVIITALGRIHPENPLLTSEISKIAELGDDRYGGQAAINAYLNSVADWCYKTYQIRPKIDSNAIVYKRILVKRPVRN